MPAYLVINAQIHDRERFLADYAPRAAELTARFGGEYVLRAPGAEVMEGRHPGGSVVISRWPNRAATLEFWNSPEYAEARKLREGIADCQVLLVDEAAAPERLLDEAPPGHDAPNIVKRTTLLVRDMASSKRWYEYVLGMTVWMDTEFVLSGQGLAAGKAGDRTHLVILRARDPKVGMIGLLQWLDPPGTPTEPAVSVDYGMPVFVVESQDARGVARRAGELGTRIHSPPRKWSTRGARGELRHLIGTSVFDPDGHFFECNQVVRIEAPTGEPMTTEQAGAAPVDPRATEER